MARTIKDVEIRPATSADIRLFYPAGAPRTSYSWLALYKGKPACLAGLIVERGGCIAYSEQLPHAAPKMTIYRAALALFEHIKGLGLPMVAACDKMNKRTQLFVESLGFERERSFNGVEMFVCKC